MAYVTPVLISNNILKALYDGFLISKGRAFQSGKALVKHLDKGGGWGSLGVVCNLLLGSTPSPQALRS